MGFNSGFKGLNCTHFSALYDTVHYTGSYRTFNINTLYALKTDIVYYYKM